MDKPGKVTYVSRLLSARQVHYACSAFRQMGSTTPEQHAAIKRASEPAGEQVGCLR